MDHSGRTVLGVSELVAQPFLRVGAPKRPMLGANSGYGCYRLGALQGQGMVNSIEEFC